MLTKKQKNFYGLMFFLVAFLCWVSYGILRRDELLRDHKIGVGKIVGYTCGGRGQGGTMYIDFKYTVDGKNYKGSSAFHCGTFQDFEEHFLFENFPIVYYPKNPNVSNILITPENFQFYSLPFPNNLKWVSQYINKP